MVTQYEVTGVITKTSDDSCVVSVTIDGKPRSFSFTKIIFYTFGIKCDGSMTNILEEGMEVELCYSISHSGSKACVLAVWLGDKPDIKGCYVPAIVYDQTGRVCRYVDSDWFVVETGDYKVSFNKGDVFRDGKRADNCGGVSIGEEITYDAVRYDKKYESCYSATCAWMGQTKPRVVDRFNLRCKNEDPEDSDFKVTARNGIRGTVAVIPSDVVAIVEVPTQSKVVKVLLFRSSFAEATWNRIPRRARIQDVVDVGDSLFMRLRTCHIFAGCTQWIAVSAMKVCEEIISESDSLSMLPIYNTGACDTESNVTDLNSEDIVSSKLVAKDVTETSVNHAGKDDVVVEIEDGIKEKNDGSSIVKTVTVNDGSKTVETAVVDDGSNTVETADVDNWSDTVETFVDDRSNTIDTAVVDDGLKTVETADVDDGSNTVGTADVDDWSDTVETVVDDRSNTIGTTVVDDGLNTIGTAVVDDESNTIEAAAVEGDVTVLNANAGVSNVSIHDIVSGALEKTFHRASNVLYRDPPLSGTISRFSFDSGHISYENLKIFVDRRNFYINGSLSTVEQFMNYVSPGVNVVNFEALKTTRPDTDKTGFTHDAICVWVGEKPTLSTVVKSLPPPKLDWLKEEEEVFFGKATTYHLPRSVLVVPGDPTTVVIDINAFTDPVPPHPSNGVPGESLITNYVKLGEYVRFELQESPDFPNLLIGCEARKAQFTFAAWNRIKSGLKVSRANVAKPQNATNSADKENTNESPVISSVQVFNAEPFAIEHSCLQRTYILNCQGVFNYNGQACVVAHPFGSITVVNPMIYDQNDNVSLGSAYCRDVFYDAVSSSVETNDNFCVERMWAPHISGTRPPAECFLFSELASPASATFVPKLHHGQITSIPLHDSAIATVKGVPVLVSLEAVVTFKEVSGYACIEELLSVGDDVALNVEKRDLPNGRTGKFHKAINCWKLGLDGKEVRAIDKIEAVEPGIPSWFNVWGFGEYYRKERVLSINGGYFVEFVSSKRPDLKLCLDLFEKGSVFVDGVLVIQEMFKKFVGSEIMFHVAHDHPENLNDFTSNGMFVACAWIGGEPSPIDVLRTRLSIPNGLVTGSDWCYDGVVEDFPLPMHVICLVGVAPVLVPLCKVVEDGNFIGVVEENLRKGDRILLRVVAEQVGDSVFLVCENALTKPGKMNRTVLKNVMGTVIETPNPKGVIQVVKSNITVRFDLCHVRSSENDVDTILRLKNQLFVGKQVRFSAVEVNRETQSFRALEVIV